MSMEYNDGYNFDEYFTSLISPVPIEKKQDMLIEINRYKDTNNYTEIKNPMLKLEYPNIQPYLPNLINNQRPNLLLQQNNIINTVPNQTMVNQTQTKTTKKRKSLAETSRELLIKQENIKKIPTEEINEQELLEPVILHEQVHEEEQQQQQEQQEKSSTESSSKDVVPSPTKKSKKNTKTTAPKKKKEAPKRKRVNYCFEIHRSGCNMNKDSKLYCKVFLKGKLQSEVDLIKGARGKWAYTFYDQRKNKKERRYWPSQSSGPVIEDPCNCGACIPNNPKKINNKINNTPIIENNEEAEFSSPSTEEATLIEYDNPQPQNIDESNQYQNEYQQVTNIPHYVEQQNHIVYYTLPPNYQTNEVQEYNQYSIKTSNDYQNLVLKSSNDFQDRNHYLKSSNDYIMNQQRNWEVQNNNNYNTNMNEYQNDNFFVENHFL